MKFGSIIFLPDLLGGSPQTDLPCEFSWITFLVILCDAVHLLWTHPRCVVIWFALASAMPAVDLLRLYRMAVPYRSSPFIAPCVQEPLSCLRVALPRTPKAADARVSTKRPASTSCDCNPSTSRTIGAVPCPKTWACALRAGLGKHAFHARGQPFCVGVSCMSDRGSRERCGGVSGLDRCGDCNFRWTYVDRICRSAHMSNAMTRMCTHATRMDLSICSRR